MAKAVLFDLDGTLLNRAESIETFIEGQYYRFEKYLQHIPLLDYSSRFIELDCGGYVWKDHQPVSPISHLSLEKIGVKASECWFVGDHPEKDIKAAKKAGLKTIWKKHLRWDVAVDADFIIQDLMEIMDIVSTGRSLSSFIHRSP